VQPSREVAGEAFLDPTGKIVNVSLTRGYLGVPPESASLGCKVVPVRIVVNADGVQPSNERILQLAVEHLDCYVKDDDGNVFNGLPEDIGMTARVTAFAEAILKECCSARRADGVAVNPGAASDQRNEGGA
jgi:hypothetical protein